MSNREIYRKITNNNHPIERGREWESEADKMFNAQVSHSASLSFIIHWQYKNVSTCLICTFKGQSHEIFFIFFPHQTAPPGPIRDVLGPFRFLWDLIEKSWDRKNFQTCINCICIVNANIKQFFE